MTYLHAADRLGNRQSRKLGNNTYLKRRSDTAIAVMLHATDVLTFNADGSTVLDSGGWQTVTTKARINEYGPGGGICQQNGQWYYCPSGWNGPRYKFADGMTIASDGTVTGADLFKPEVQKAALKLRRQAQAYAGKFLRALAAGKVPAPSGGDCWFCALREVNTGKPWGECNHDTSHILEHLREQYFVPSLLARAIETFPVSQVAKWFLAERWGAQPTDASQLTAEIGSFDTIAIEQLQKSLSRYIIRQLGQAA